MTKQLFFCPIDLEISNFELPAIYQNKKWMWWSSEYLTEQAAKGISSPLRKDLDSSYQPIFDIINQLPLVRYDMVRFSRQMKEISPHCDIYKSQVNEDEFDDYLDTEPAGYRILLKGSTSALKVFANGSWHQPVLPNSPMCYIINTTKCIHSVDDDPDRITLYLRGKMDKEKHQALLSKSLEKYGHLAIWNEVT
jgi:hypothetical protein